MLVLPFLGKGQGVDIPVGPEVIAEVEGDLDKDGIAEKVVVLNTNDTTDFGIVREIKLFKQSEKKWTLWRSSKNAILKSEEGGMMGDPFAGIDIKDGILLISHFGGSSWKWSYTDKYRFQNNEFQLIGYSSIHGKVCELWTSFDFNLSTGKIIYETAFEDCENQDQVDSKREEETFYQKGVIIGMNDRNQQKVKIITPKYKQELYL